MSTYKYGSMKLSHENQNLTVPSMRWLGVRSADISLDAVGLLKLSGRDRRIATCLLGREVFQQEQVAEWRRELQVMLMLNCKAEIQILSGGGNGLEGWLDMKLTDAMNSTKA